MLELVDVSQSFGSIHAADELSLQLKEGEIHCLLGASGSGKTTILRIIAGLQKPDSGSVKIADEVVVDAKRFVVPQKRPVGMIFQDTALFPYINVIKNVTFGATGNKKDSEATAIQLLDEVGLSERVKSDPQTLSGGEQQRVAIARALLGQPKVLLLDEPLSSLDTALRKELCKLLVSTARRRELAVLWVTHDPSIALANADRISVIESGKILQTGYPETIYFQPNSEIVAKMLGDVNVLDAPSKDGKLFLRPEQVSVVPLVEERIAGAIDTDNVGTIMEIKNEGATKLLSIKLKQQVILSRLLSPCSLGVGESVFVRGLG